MNRHKWRQLIDDLIEGDISEADFIRLEAEMSLDPSLRKEYLDRVKLSLLLKTEAEEFADGASKPANGILLDSPVAGWLRFISGTGIMLSILGLAWLAWGGSEGDDLAPATNNGRRAVALEAEATGYGVISGQDGVVWADGVARATGSLLPTGELQLVLGVVQLELFSGVSLVVEGPAEFAVTSPMNMSVGQGKVRAHVPEPAHGFRVSTRDGEVIDLGTDFAVDVSELRSELHVLEGEVELRSNGQARRLATGQALRLSDATKSNSMPGDLMPADHDRFVGQNEIADRLQLALKSRRGEWLKWSHELRKDPRLVALYQPGVSEDHDAWQTDRRIVNQASREFGASEGAAVAAARTTDRWQHRDGALNFSPTGSRVRLTIPGEYRSLTLMCWVKINSLDRWYNSLFLTDGHEQHEPHWQIMDDGRLFFSVKKRDEWDPQKGEKDKHVYYSPPFWNNSLSGQWLMIATVYDVDQRAVTHFVNGQSISEEAIPEEYLVERVKIGNASLCNWSSPERDEPRFAVRNLNGSLDEFAVFRAALSSEEILEMYDHGKP